MPGDRPSACSAAASMSSIRGVNRHLFDSVRRHGALVSEYFLGEAPLAWRFPARNRIIAGLASTVVVVEAPEHSGALITARHGLDAGRDVWAVPGPPGVRECRGSNGLLADGAGVLWDIPEFLEAVAPRGRTETRGPGVQRPCWPARDRGRRAFRGGTRTTRRRRRRQAQWGIVCPSCFRLWPCSSSRASCTATPLALT